MPAQDRYWTSDDGLRLHARDYPGGEDGQPPLLCLPGLTRNARDFEPLARRLAGRWRVIAVDYRGRGESAAAKDAMSYVPQRYAADVAELLAELGIARVVAIGTSLGGLVTMLLAQGTPGLIAGAVLNDIGPHVEAAGLARIRGYVGRGSSLPTWLHAARCLHENNREVYPDWALADWLAMAKRVYRLNGAGRVVLDYDLRIAEPFRMPGQAPAPDWWSAYAALGDAPVLVVRGARSDLLSAATAQRMVADLPGAELVTVADVGHAPLLTEAVAAAAIDRLLTQVAEPAPA